MAAPLLDLDERRGMDKQKALDSALAQIERNFGKGSIMKLGQENAVMDIEAVSTGSIGLDIALGIGGLPKGRIIEVYGPESSGKTTLALHVVAEEQKKGGICAFVDAEHALDPQYAKKLGVNLDELLISQPDAGEQALEITETLVRSGAVSVVVVDSVAALTPKSELEGDMGDAQVGSQARLMSQAMRKLTSAISRSNCMVIFINQIRMKIGVMFGSPETTTGGNALKFYASVRLDIRRIGALKDRDEVVGNARIAPSSSVIPGVPTTSIVTSSSRDRYTTPVCVSAVIASMLTDAAAGIPNALRTCSSVTKNLAWPSGAMRATSPGRIATPLTASPICWAGLKNTRRALTLPSVAAGST